MENFREPLEFLHSQVTKSQRMKGYKVTDKNRGKLVGVACDNLKQLLAKGKEKLGIADDVTVALDDGTIVDDEDYFLQLPPQTIFIFYRKDESIVTGVDLILNVLRQVNTSYLETGSKAKEFITEKTNELISMLQGSAEEQKGQILKNTPQEDPDWFEGVETNARTKDEYMFKKSQDRIRGYFYKLQEDLRKSKMFAQDPRFRKTAVECLEFLKRKLKEDEYFGCYFDRRCAVKKEKKECDDEPVKKKSRKDRNRRFCFRYDKFSYCDEEGKFVCQGKWKVEDCEFQSEHQINPYLSREARILFSTWNLDHRYISKCFSLQAGRGFVRGFKRRFIYNVSSDLLLVTDGKPYLRHPHTLNLSALHVKQLFSFIGMVINVP